ncbi:hypothetical protein Tco_1476055 [Tanacetum coccineum]
MERTASRRGSRVCPCMPDRILLAGALPPSNLVTMVVVVLQLGTFPLEVPWTPHSKTSRLLTRPSAPLMEHMDHRGDNCILSIGVWIPHIVSSQQSLQHKPCRCSASCFGGVFVVVGYYLAFSHARL